MAKLNELRFTLVDWLTWLRAGSTHWFRFCFSLLSAPSIRPLLDRFYRIREALARRSLKPHRYYTSLPAQSIRLLRIRQWSCGLLYCSLETVPLAGSPSYTALSYTWAREDPRARTFANFLLSITKAVRGDAKFRHDESSGTSQLSDANRLIVCDNKALMITQNLFDGLTSVCLSKSNAEDYWWIDQICINQADEVEKSMQVPLMGSIYRQASHVAVWLGRGSAWEIRHLRYLPKLLGSPPARGDRNHWSWAMNSAWTAMSLANIARRSWFSRVWIVQELALARKLNFFLGGYSITYNDLYQSVNWLFDTASCMGGTSIVVDAIGFRRIAGLLASRRYLQDHGHWTIEQWMSAIRGHRAWDPRDYVYGGLSLLSEADRSVIRVDYSRSRGDVFMDVTRYLLSHQSGIHTLSLAERGSTQGSVPSIDRPTWEISADCAASRTPMLELGHGRFSACPTTETEEFTASQDFLHTRAVLVDKISIVCSESLLDTGDGIEDLLQIILKMGQSYQWTGEDPLVALARTITADSISIESPQWGDRQQTIVTFIVTLAQLTRMSQGRKDSEVSPTSRFAATWPRYHNFDWSRDWITSYPWWAKLSSVVLPSDQLSMCMKSATLGRRLFMTEQGMIGLGPASTQKGQTVAILAGARIPYLLNSLSSPPLDLETLSAWDKALIARARSIHRAEPAILGLKVGTHVYGERLKAFWETQEIVSDDVDEYKKVLEQVIAEHQERFCLQNLPMEGGLFSSMQFMGETYLHGFMYGEVERLVREGVLSWQPVDIQ